LTVPRHPVLDANERFQRRLLAGEQQVADRLTQTYQRAFVRLQAAIEALAERAAELEQPTRYQVMKLAALRSLQLQAVDEINKFAVYADTEVSNAAAANIQQALADSRDLVAAYFPQPQMQQAIAARWDMLPVEQVETALGFLADDSPLHDALTAKLGPTVAQRMADALVDGIALGKNPREIARIARRELGVGLSWALTTARTAQLWSYREATRANYMANSDIVSGWRWHATFDARTCMSCIAQHGSLHQVSEVLNDHHNGRCTQIPEVPLARRFGIAMPEIEAGEQWFNRQPEAQQRQRMGPGMFDAWKAGAFQFNQLSEKYDDSVYGEMLREASLKGMLGDRAKEFYQR
jgi:hypothetical protein